MNPIIAVVKAYITVLFNFSQWFEDLKKSWNEDFVPQFMSGFKIFLICLAAIAAIVGIIFLIRFFVLLASAKNKK